MSDAPLSAPLAGIERAGPRGMVTIRGDLAATALKNACTSLAGVDFPGQGGANCVGERGLLWMSPDELMLLVPHDAVPAALATLEKALAAAHHLVADVSDARALFLVSGPRCREVMGKLTPADLHPDAFRPGTLRRTRLAQVAAAFWMRDAQTFEVIVFRSVADYAEGLLRNAARPGTAVGLY